jgi:hypothetical protein
MLVDALTSSPILQCMEMVIEFEWMTLCCSARSGLIRSFVAQQAMNLLDRSLMQLGILSGTGECEPAALPIPSRLLCSYNISLTNTVFSEGTIAPTASPFFVSLPDHNGCPKPFDSDSDYDANDKVSTPINDSSISPDIVSSLSPEMIQTSDGM